MPGCTPYNVIVPLQIPQKSGLVNPIARTVNGAVSVTGPSVFDMHTPAVFAAEIVYVSRAKSDIQRTVLSGANKMYNRWLRYTAAHIIYGIGLARVKAIQLDAAVADAAVHGIYKRQCPHCKWRIIQRHDADSGSRHAVAVRSRNACIVSGQQAL